MKGHFPTPSDTAFLIVRKLFDGAPPQEGDRVLYPGLGTGPFVQAVQDYCQKEGLPIPEGVGIENDPDLLDESEESLRTLPVEIRDRDFLSDVADLGRFKYIVGNPPYVPIEQLSEEEKKRYRRRFDTAQGRFNLYLLFYEQSLGLLQDGGRLAFITPEKFEYTLTSARLREMLSSSYHLQEIHYLDEGIFEDLLTYPTVTVVGNGRPGKTRVRLRDGTEKTISLPEGGSSWASAIRGGVAHPEDANRLGDLCERISCGVATGADAVFVQPEDELPPNIHDWTYPTISGRQLSNRDAVETTDCFICPYDTSGDLQSEDDLGAYAEWAELKQDVLKDRTCVKSGRKDWFAWHETPPMEDILQPKILCQDLTKEPKFWLDEGGKVVPRHTVYYLIPKRKEWLDPLLDFLNSQEAIAWIESNAQRATSGSLRLQSTVLKELPVPTDVISQPVQDTL